MTENINPLVADMQQDSLYLNQKNPTTNLQSNSRALAVKQQKYEQKQQLAFQTENSDCTSQKNIFKDSI